MEPPCRVVARRFDFRRHDRRDADSPAANMPLVLEADELGEVLAAAAEPDRDSAGR